MHKSVRQMSYKPKSVVSKFCSATETSLTCGISLHSYHAHGGKREIDFLHHSGIEIPYNKATKHISQIACAVKDNMKKHEGIYIPANLSKDKPILGSLDNIDSQVGTPDGRNSFHVTAMAVYQEIAPSEEEIFSDPLELNQITDLRWVDIPKSLLDVQETKVTGNPKPYQSPRYPDFQLGQYDEESKAAEESDLAWLLARHFNRQKCGTRNLQDHESETCSSSETGEPTIEFEDIEVTTEEFNDNSKSDSKKQDLPLWGAYNSLIIVRDGRVDYAHPLPIINYVANHWSTLITGLEYLSKSNKIVREENAPLGWIWISTRGL